MTQFSGPAQPDQTRPADGTGTSAFAEKLSPPRRILGLQPILFAAIVALIAISLLTIGLLFAGEFTTQVPRVVWTVVALVCFTGFLALDMHWARRTQVPLLIGAIANTYLLALLMLTTWLGRGSAGDLLMVYFWSILGVRGAAAAAWGLVTLGERTGGQIAPYVAQIAAALVGFSSVLLTLPFLLDTLNVPVESLYWQVAVSVLILAALAACIAVLLYRNRQSLDYEARKAAGLTPPEPHRPGYRPPTPDYPAGPGPYPYLVPPPGSGSQPQQANFAPQPQQANFAAQPQQANFAAQPQQQASFSAQPQQPNFSGQQSSFSAPQQQDSFFAQSQSRERPAAPSDPVPSNPAPTNNPGTPDFAPEPAADSRAPDATA